MNTKHPQRVIGRSTARWAKRPMYLRPYHLTHVVLYYGQRENKWRLESEIKWRALINRMHTELNLLIQVVECYDDACAGCKYLAKDEMGSVWGVGYTCRSAQKPEMVKDVVNANRYVLKRVGLSAGGTILLKDLIPILKDKIPKLELNLIGGMKSQEPYEKGLADLLKKHRQRKEVKNMPNRNGKGPKGRGPRDGHGGGKGKGTNKPAGAKKGGKKGGC